MTAAGPGPGVTFVALVASALALAGCARQQSEPVAQVQPQPAICQPRPVPDCELRGVDVRTVDPAEFERLKLAYEQRCIRRAERAERQRLRALQASGTCVAQVSSAVASR
jgi:hypothetical protein